MPSVVHAGSHRVRSFIGAVLLLLLPSSAALPRAQTFEGDLDPTFGTGGRVTTDFFNATDIAHSMAIQNDGKIVVAGEGKNLPSTISAFVLVRYTVDGVPDTSFGNAGKVITFFGSGQIGNIIDAAYAVVIQRDGKILAAGHTRISGHISIALARYNTDGSLDAEFGLGGTVTINPHGFDSEAYGLALQSDGKILVAGMRDSSRTRNDFLLVRYLADGTLDNDFGAGGFVSTDFAYPDEPFGSNDQAHGIVVQPDGKILLAGFRSHGASPGGSFPSDDFALARYNPDGSPDMSFGSVGKVTTDFGGSDYGDEVALQLDGKIVVAGSASQPNPGYFALSRYNSDGGLDNSFGFGGKVTTANTVVVGAAGMALAIQKDARIIAGGRSTTGWTLTRYNSGGSLDTSFGNGGVVQNTFSEFGDTVNAIAIQSDNKIVAAGNSFSSGTGSDIAVARYDALIFDVCVQDDSSGYLLQFNSTTADYQFTNCSGFTIGGVGLMTRRGSVVTLQQNGPDRRVMAKVDGSVNKGTASVQVFSRGTTFTITDTNTLNNTCSCANH